MKQIVQRFWAILVIILIWFAFSSPYFVRGLIPFSSTYLVSFFAPWNATNGMPVKNNAMPDVITQIFPWKKLTIDTWKSGAIPLWNPYSFSGTPLAANYQSAVFSPMNLLFFILPFVDAWSVLILLQPLVAGIGMYLFIRRLSRSKTGALIGAVGFMFCGFMTTWMAYGTLAYAIAFLPWSLWAVASDFIKKSRFTRIVLPVSVALSFVSGHFQISIYVIVTVVLYIMYKSLQTRRWNEGIVLLLYSGCGLLLAAPQLLLTFDAYKASTRSASFVKVEVIPWRYLITVFAPDFFGNPVTRNDWFGHYAEWSSYIGIAPLVLALYGIVRNIKADKKFFITLGLLSIVLAYPTPFNDLLFWLKIPAISTSAASRIIVLVSFSLAVLASYGFDDLTEYWRSNKRAPAIFLAVLFTIITILWIIVLFGKPMQIDKLAIAKRNLVLPTLFSIVTIALMLIGSMRRKYIRAVAVTCIVGLVLFDSYRYASKWMPFDPRQFIYPPEKSLTFLQSKVGNDRVMGNIGNEVGGMFRLPLIEGYDALYQGRYAELINASSNGQISQGTRSVVLFDKHGKYKSEILQLLGVRYIYDRLSDGRNVWAFPYWEYLSDSSMKQIYRDNEYEILEYEKAYPRAFLASSYTIEKDDQSIIKTLFNKNFDLRETLVLEKKPPFDPEKGSGSTDILSYEPNRVIIKISSAVPKLLFLSDVYDEGWHVSIDGKPAPLYRADYDFRAASLPKGNHIIQFFYSPRSLHIGFIFAAIGLVIIVLGVLFITIV